LPPIPQRSAADEATAVRARAALGRAALSRPIRLAVEDGLIDAAETTVLDYGCGKGGDVERLRRSGVCCHGWDPFHHPDGVLEPSDVVNIGYVVNVIEDLEERRQTLRRAWELARRVLVVSARLKSDSPDLEGVPFRDGVRTSIGTFQKLYTQNELRGWIEGTLGARPVAAAPGVFLVFRHQAFEELWLLKRVRRHAQAPISRELLAQHADLLQPLVDFLAERGRLPRGEELDTRAAIEAEFGTLRNAFATIRRVSGTERWDRIRDERSRDLLVYLALSRFDRRPRPRDLPAVTRLDIRDLFGSHAAACRQADRLLAELSNQERIREAAVASPVGKRMPQALYLHADGIALLPPVLRVLDGAARRLIGELDAATVVKIHLDRPTVSYLEYPGFDELAHPALHSGYLVKIDGLQCDFRDYSRNPNPPILHRKEMLLAADDERAPRFSALTRQEERAGLFDHPQTIGRQRQWEALLAAKRVRIAGHRLVKVADVRRRP
jgi:DNA phosphorothioation-associated putative methyltransferase